MTATVFSWTRTWHRFGGTEDLEIPFTSVLAEVNDCGVRLLGRLDDPFRIDPRIGELLVGHTDRASVGGDIIPVITWSRTA